MPEEIPLGEDCKDWNNRITDAERNLLTQVFRFFTQSDVEVQDNYMERYARVFRPTEIKMMLAAFANMETVHIAAYALLLETLGMPDSEFTAFMDYAAMRDKHDYLQGFGVETDADTLRTLAVFGGFTEGLQLFASFAILLNFPRHNKMRGMGQVVSWSVRDETLHCEGIIRLFHTFAQETGALTQTVKDDIVDCARTVVKLEDRFVDLAFEMGPIEGLSAAGDQGLHPLHRRLAPEAVRPAAGLWREGTSAALAHRHAERRRTRELLRDARHRIRQGRDRWRVARRRRRVGAVRPRVARRGQLGTDSRNQLVARRRLSVARASRHAPRRRIRVSWRPGLPLYASPIPPCRSGKPGGAVS